MERQRPRKAYVSGFMISSDQDSVKNSDESATPASWMTPFRVDSLGSVFFLSTWCQGTSQLALTVAAIVAYGRWNDRRQGLD